MADIEEAQGRFAAALEKLEAAAARATSVYLVDRVIPHVPVRQWVLTLPVGLRYRMAFDAQLTSEILRAFLRTLFASLRRKARTICEIRYPRAGARTGSRICHLSRLRC